MATKKNKSIDTETNQQGYVYILTNPSFKDDWVKIGKSARPVDLRSKELDNTAVPLPFKIYATLKTRKYEKVEKQIHKQIDRLTDLRIRQNREFFNINPETALEILRDIADLLEDAEVAIYDKDGKPVISKSKEEDKRIKADEAEKNKRTQKPPFKFSMIGLKTGDIVTFDPLKLKVKVSTDNKIEYEGRLWSLSNFTATYLPEDQQTESRSYQGPKYFSYKGKTLAAIRKELEE